MTPLPPDGPPLAAPPPAADGASVEGMATGERSDGRTGGGLDRAWSMYGVSLAVVVAFYRTVFGLRVIGRERLPAGPLIVAANHASYLDPPAVGAALSPRHLSYLAKSELFAFAPFGALIRSLNAFPVDRSKGDVAAIRRAVAILREGRALLVFPEGGRNRDGSAQAKNGVALLARLSGAPVVPAYVEGTAGARLRRPVTVVFGEPRRFVPAPRDREAADRWRERLMADVFALRGELDAATRR